MEPWKQIVGVDDGLAAGVERGGVHELELGPRLTRISDDILGPQTADIEQLDVDVRLLCATEHQFEPVLQLLIA